MIVTLRVFDRLDPNQCADIHGSIGRFTSEKATAFAHVLAAARRVIEDDIDREARKLLWRRYPAASPARPARSFLGFTMELARGVYRT